MEQKSYSGWAGKLVQYIETIESIIFCKPDIWLSPPPQKLPRSPRPESIADEYATSADVDTLGDTELRALQPRFTV